MTSAISTKKKKKGDLCERCKSEPGAEVYERDLWVCEPCALEAQEAYRAARADRVREHRRRAKKKALCGRCLKRPAAPGFRACGKCALRARESQQKRVKRLKADGKCIVCGIDNRDGVCCPECREKRKGYG